MSGAGCAFIKYSQRDQAQAAINALNGVCVMDVRFVHYEGVVKFAQFQFHCCSLQSDV